MLAVAADPRDQPDRDIIARIRRSRVRPVGAAPVQRTLAIVEEATAHVARGRSRRAAPPPPAGSPYAVQRAWWMAELARRGFVDIEQPDGSLREEPAIHELRRQPHRKPAALLAEEMAFHDALCAAQWRYPFATSDERECVRLAVLGWRHASIATELGRRKVWVGAVIARSVEWGLRELNADVETEECG